MIDKSVYRATFSRLHASDQAKQEVLNKMETQKSMKKFRPLRTIGMVAAIVAALCVTAGAVNAVTGGELFRSFTITWSDGFQMELEDKDGNAVNAYLTGGQVDRVDGRLILRALGQEVDITDALERDGVYRLEDDSTGKKLCVEVTGSTEEWTLTSYVDGGNGGLSFTTTGEKGHETLPEDAVDAGSASTAAERNGSKNVED